jgi:protein phosphatase
MTVSPEQTAPASGATRKPRDAEIDVFGLTHAGRVRQTNQDHFLIASLHKTVEIHGTSLPTADRFPRSERLAFLAMVADGVGGGAAGEAASRVAVESVTEYVSQSMRCFYTSDTNHDDAFHEALQEAALRSHGTVVAHAGADEDLQGMATTLTLWLGVWPRAYLLQVGDSRCYVLRDGELTQISRDQTMAQDLIDQGVLRRTEAINTRWAHVLSSSIGGRSTMPLVTRMEQDWGTVGLLCSDGLTKHVSDDQIRQRLLTMTSARQVCQVLVQDALDGGGSDNITVLVGRTITPE